MGIKNRVCPGMKVAERRARLENKSADPRRFYFATLSNGSWAFFVLASLFASPPYRTQRMDFAVQWLLACCRLKSDMHAAPYLVRVAQSHPGGRALLAFAPTTFCYPLSSARDLCLASRACWRNLSANKTMLVSPTADNFACY